MKNIVYFFMVLVFYFLLTGKAFTQEISSQSEGEKNLTTTESAVGKEENSEIVTKKAESERKTIENDAVIAIKETQNALKFLEENDKNNAIQALEKAVGKLELLLSREPSLEFAPVYVSVVVNDIYATPEMIDNLILQAKYAINSDNIQRARFLICQLRSEVDIRVTSVPLATFPTAIKSIVKMIDQNQLEQAKIYLRTALNTLVITEHVLPLPYLKSLEILKRIYALGEKPYTEKQSQEISALLKVVKNEIKMAEALRYGTKSKHRPLYTLLRKMNKKITKKENIANESYKAREYLLTLINPAS